MVANVHYTNPNTLRKRIANIFIILLIGIPVIYTAFRLYPLLTGPQITVYYPQDGSYVSSSTFQIAGKVTRATSIYLQGKAITVDIHGEFVETLVATYPYTILVLVAKDQYQASKTVTLRVVPK